MNKVMEKRSTVKWWKGLYELKEMPAIMLYVFERLDRGTFRSQRNSAFNLEAIDYVVKEATRKPTALEFAQKEVTKWEKS